MTESEWNSCTRPLRMLEWLRDSRKASGRSLGLFACACCRRIWHVLTDERLRRTVEYVEGASGRAQLDAALKDAERVLHAAAAAANQLEEEHDRKWQLGEQADWPASELLVSGRLSAVSLTCAAEAVVWAARAQGAGDDRAPLTASGHASEFAAAAVEYMEWQRYGAALELDAAAWKGVAPREKGQQATLLRDIIGNPFRVAPSVEPSVLQWNRGAVVQLAQAAYEVRILPEGHLDPARMAVLADAVEEAGCTDLDIIGHLRDPRPHVRGCHIIDLLLSKE